MPARSSEGPELLVDTSVVSFERYDVVYEDGINRRGGPYIAWFKDPGANVLSVLRERA